MLLNRTKQHTLFLVRTEALDESINEDNQRYLVIKDFDGGLTRERKDAGLTTWSTKFFSS